MLHSAYINQRGRGRERERENVESWRGQERERWGPIHRPYARSLTKTKPIYLSIYLSICDRSIPESNPNPNPKIYVLTFSLATRKNTVLSISPKLLPTKPT
jgi:hypothetical protein